MWREICQYEKSQSEWFAWNQAVDFASETDFSVFQGGVELSNCEAPRWNEWVSEIDETVDLECQIQSVSDKKTLRAK